MCVLQETPEDGNKREEQTIQKPWHGPVGCYYGYDGKQHYRKIYWA